MGSATPAGTATQIIADEPLVAAVGHADPLAGRSAITLRALSDRTLISLPMGTGTRSCLDEACAAAALQPRIAFEATDPGVVARLAARGLGVGVLPDPSPKLVGPRCGLTITRPSLRGRLALAWRAEGPSSPAAKALVAHAGTVLAAA